MRHFCNSFENISYIKKMSFLCHCHFFFVPLPTKYILRTHLNAKKSNNNK